MSESVKDPYAGADKGVLQAIGLVIVNFSQLESLLRLGLSILLVGTKSDDAPELVATKLGFAQTVDLFACLYRHRFTGEPIGQLDAVCKELDSLNSKRNHLVHSFWGTGKNATTLTQVRSQARRKGPVVSDIQVSEAEVLGLATAIDQGYSILADLLAPVFVNIDERLSK